MEMEQRFEELCKIRGSAIVYSPALDVAALEQTVRGAFKDLPFEVVKARAALSERELQPVLAHLGKGPGCLFVDAAEPPNGALVEAMVRIQRDHDVGVSETSVVLATKVATPSQLNDYLVSSFGFVWGF